MLSVFLFFQGCRSVEEFQCLNRIEEGTYGVVYRAKDKKTGQYKRSAIVIFMVFRAAVVCKLQFCIFH